MKKHSFQTFCFLIFFAIIMCIRAPDVFVYGRFWAEEGYVFFYNAWTMPPLQALFNSFGGYLNLPTNAVTLVARWGIPLEYAPYFTTIVGLLFQLLPLFLLLTAKDEWLLSFKVRLFLTLLLLFVPESQETSLQSLHIQFQLTLACAIILFLEPCYSYQRWLKLFTLMLAGLSGVMSIVLLPIYVVRYFVNRNKLKLEELITLLTSSLIQYCFFYEKITSRFHDFRMTDFLDIFFIRELYMPFLGVNRYTYSYTEYLYTHMKDMYAALFPAMIVLLFIIGILGIFYKQPKTRQGAFLFFSALLLFVVSIIGSIGNREYFLIPFVDQRYVFISQFLLCILLVFITYNLPFIQQKVGKIIIYWLIFVGAIHFFAHPNMYIIKAPNGYLGWHQQVLLWKENPNYNFQIWPGNKMVLPVNK